ncbi:MAG: pyridoxal phosphate-dependent aminotransferase [Galactobacillus timonensis]|uniref:MalY/PatB family protein n=1 Tax=Galactobacillus timonensis TaxID=2041840 RepID=UPI0023F3311F|nr:MalY/PatB family protein [Galactobacillus timonensis]MCI6067557.1 pyridoxal phosphate-dependent aminotransferase [Galactobacillus timonensis]
MKFDFDQFIDRRGTTSIKWNFQEGFGQKDGLLPFWIADTDFATVPEVVEALKKRCEHPVFGYSDPLPSTYEAIQGWWQRRHGWRPDTEWMFMTCGVVTGIYFALQALVEKGDKVLTFTPVYDPFFKAIENSGHTLVACPLHHEDDYYTIDWDLFENELKNGVKAIVFCNPHNPVGRVWTKEELSRFVDLCAQYKVWVLSDEVHADYGLTRDYTPMGVFEKIHDHLVIYTAISKTFNLAGLVSACIMVPNKEVREKVRYEFDSRWMFGPTDFAFTAMEAGYNHGDEWMDAVCEYLRGNVAFVNSYVSEHMPKIHVTRHEGTFLMWLDMRCAGISSSEMTSILAKDYGIALGDGSHYGKEADGFMRLNIGCTRAVLLQGLQAIEKFYQSYVK